MRPPLPRPCAGYCAHVLIPCARPAPEPETQAQGHHPVSGEDWLFGEIKEFPRLHSPGDFASGAQTNPWLPEPQAPRHNRPQLWPQSSKTEPNQELTRAGCWPVEPMGLAFCLRCTVIWNAVRELVSDLQGTEKQSRGVTEQQTLRVNTTSFTVTIRKSRCGHRAAHWASRKWQQPQKGVQVFIRISELPE